MRPLNVELQDELRGRGKAWFALAALAAFAFGCGLVVMAFMSMHYDSRLEAVQAAHNKSISSMEGRHTREKNKTRTEITEKLDAIEKKLDRIEHHLMSKR